MHSAIDNQGLDPDGGPGLRDNDKGNPLSNQILPTKFYLGTTCTNSSFIT